MITMHARPRQTGGQTDRRTNIMAIARRFVLTNALRAKYDFRVLSCNVTTFAQPFCAKFGIAIEIALDFNSIYKLD